MATWHVSTTGNDTTGDGSLATPWRTILKAIGSGNASLAAGDTIHVAPGWYNEVQITPNVIGTVGNEITLKGDFTGAIFGTAGWVVIDPSTGAGAYNAASSYRAFMKSDKWDYWIVQGFEVGPGVHSVAYTAEFSSITAGQTLNSLKIRDCSFHSDIAGSPLFIEGWDLGGDTTNVIQIERCNIINSYGEYGVGLTVKDRNTTSTKTNYQILVKNCNLFGAFYAIQQGYSATYYTRVHYLDCSINGGYALKGSSATYNHALVQRCLLKSRIADNGITVATADTNYKFGVTATGTAVTRFPWHIPFNYLMSLSDMVNKMDYSAVSAPIATDDMFGTARPTSGTAVWTPGCVEFETGDEPEPPVGELAVGGGDFPDPGNVTEDDTTNGVTGTYHEATVAEVQSGVTFGAASALTGTYAGGGLIVHPGMTGGFRG